MKENHPIFERVPFDDPEEYREWYRQNIAGTFRTSWTYLLDASASCYFSAAAEFSQIIDARNGGLEEGISRGEVCVMLELNYRMWVAGPVLSAILTPAFALETFIRLCGFTGLRSRVGGGEELLLALGGFDRLSPQERVRMVFKLAGASDVPQELQHSLGALIRFRNSTVHDVPLLQGPHGEFIRTQPRNARLNVFDVERANQGFYPVLHNTVMPLTLRHATKAIDTHDGLVTHLFDTCDSDFKDEFSRQLSPEHRKWRKIRDVGYKQWERAEAVSDYWANEVVPWYEGVSLPEKDDFLEGMARRSTIKIVEDEEPNGSP
jgi:hypothetical protein